MAKITSDYLWLASAMEGWVCATLLLEYLQADMGVWVDNIKMRCFHTTHLFCSFE